MFKAVKSGKIRLKDGFEELRGANLFKLNEDFLTATVFSRLLYMPADVLSALLLPAYGSSPGKLKEAMFWPTWWATSGNGATIRVEPDLYVEFESLDLIVEAKLNDDPGCQTPEQWAREWAAWHQGTYTGPGKEPLLLGVGGFGASDNVTKAAASEIVETANRLLQVDFPGVPAIRAAGLSWQGLYDRLTSNTLDDQISSRLVQDLREILGYFGLRRYQYLGTLVGTMRQSMVDTIGDGLEVVKRWSAPRSEQDWLATSKSLRPIMASSIEIFRRRAWSMTMN
jgi:hypothetical protein